MFYTNYWQEGSLVPGGRAAPAKTIVLIMTH